MPTQVGVCASVCRRGVDANRTHARSGHAHLSAPVEVHFTASVVDTDASKAATAHLAPATNMSTILPTIAC